MLVVIIGDTDDKVLSDVRSRVNGTEIPVEECASMTYTDYLKKVRTAYCIHSLISMTTLYPHLPMFWGKVWCPLML